MTTAHIQISPTEDNKGYIAISEIEDADRSLCMLNTFSAETELEVHHKIVEDAYTYSDDIAFEGLSRTYEVWTDGSANNLSPYGECGAAYIILQGEKELKRMSKGFLYKTNNWCEMMAIVSAVASIPPRSEIDIYTDSKYAISVFTDKDITRRINNIAQMFCKYADGKVMRFHWMKGHNGVRYNEECDKMAKERMLEIRSKYNIPVYNWRNSPKVKKKGA